MDYSELRFKIVEEKLGTIPSYKLLDTETGEYVSVLPSIGGAINAMALNNKGELVEIMKGYTSEESLKETLETSFRGSNLFPFPNRIRDGKYSFKDIDYQLDVNFPDESNAIHGLVYKTPFRIVDKEDGEIGCTLILEYRSEPSPGYPFQYLFKIIYKLKEFEGFECKIKVANMTDQSIPVGHGWHPYFLADSDKVDELSLQFPAESMLEVDERNIPTGVETPYKVFQELKPVADTGLDNCFQLAQEDVFAEIVVHNPAAGFGYRIWQETGKYKYNFVQIYTPPDRKSIAIEPMTCAPDAFNNEKGLIVLGPLENFQALWGISHLSE